MANKKVKFELTAIDKTKAAFDKASNGLSRVGSAAKGATKVIAGTTLAIGGVATALGLATRKSLDYIDAIGKTAKRTGISTDLLQAFQQGAIEAGSSIEQAQKGLEKFTSSVGDASRGLKTQADIFKDLGVEITDTNGNIKEMTDILFETADGISELGSEASKATALANLFGRSGMQFAEIFQEGSEGIKAFIEEGKQLGFIIGADGIRTVEKFNDVISQIKASAGGLANQIVASLAPAFLSMANALKEFIIEQAALVGGFDNLGKAIALSMIEAVRASIGAVAELINSLNKITQVETHFANLLRLAGKLRGMKVDFVPYETVINVENINSSLDTLKDKVENNDFVASEFFNNFNQGMTDLQSPLQVFIDSLGEKGLQKTLEQNTVSAMKKFEDSIITTLKTGKASFKDFADYVIDQLLRVAIQQAIIAPFTEKFGGKFAEFGKKLFDFEGGGYTGMGARAGGVDGRGGFPAILHPNETVIDHTKGQSMGATVNFNISTVDAAGFDQLLASRKGLITSIINNAMNNQGKMGVV